MASRRSPPPAAQYRHPNPERTGGRNGNIFATFMENMQQGMQQQSRGVQSGGGGGGGGVPQQDMRAHAAAVAEQQRREQLQELRQRGPPPASRLALKNIPDVKIAAIDLAEETNRSCSICLEDQELGGKAAKLPCGHIFHRECLLEWLELHCTCPVCRFELETEDSGYEKERRVRMQGRRPRYRKQELEGLSIPQIRNLARGQNVNIAGCLEKADIVRCLIDSGTIDLVESETPTYDAEDLSNMGLRQLRSLMLQAGIEVEGCLEKADLLERVMSSRLVNITHRNPPQPRPPQPPQPPHGYHVSGEGRGRGEGGSIGSTREMGSAAGMGSAMAEGATVGGGRERNDRRRAGEGSSDTSSSTGRTAGWWWAGRSRRSGGRGGGTAEAETAAVGAPSPTSPPPPAVRTLESMSVKELREITSRLGVSTAGCIEKRDMVERIRGSGRYRE